MHTILSGSHNPILSPKRRYFIASDFHLEFRQGEEQGYWDAFPESKGVKVCICAGDLTVFGQPDVVVYKHFIGLCNRFEKVVYVPGNHEYYGSNPTDVERRLAEIEYFLRPTLTVLRAGQPYVYEGQRFVGDTMWFVDKPEVHIYRRLISDSFQIKGLFPWCFTQSSLFMNWIKSNLHEDDIVITHHVPNDMDTLPRWKMSNTQAYFLNDECNRYFLNPNAIRPKAWIYGHTHDQHDYRIGRTRFVCNPIGYPGERGYLPDLEPMVYEI